MESSVRHGYEELGIDNYYKIHCNDYSNPHSKEVNYLLKTIEKSGIFGKSILDLCCGSGEVTQALRGTSVVDFKGCDPYTYELYEKNTGFECLKYSFKDIIQGVLSSEHFDSIICSFALHLCEVSMLDTVLYQLSCISDILVILTPHKRPEIRNWWTLVDEIKYNRVSLRVYRKAGNLYVF